MPEKQIKLDLTDSEVDDIVYALDMRASMPDVAPEWRKQYKALANKISEQQNKQN